MPDQTPIEHASQWALRWLGCQWGTTVRTVSDPHRCGELAAQQVVLHDGPALIGPIRLCRWHSKVVEDATDPHQEVKPTRDRCVNHPEATATRTARMPTGQKQPDGSYTEHVPLCQDCAERIAAIGFDVIKESNNA